MDEQESAKKSYDNLVNRVERLNDDYVMLIDSITDLREKMYTLIDQIIQNQHQNNPNNSIERVSEKQQKFSSSSSYHVDYQYLQNHFEIVVEKLDQQFIKDMAKDFWKLYLKFSLLDGNRVHHLLIKAKALGYSKVEEVIQKKDILRRYFVDQNQLDEQQKQVTQSAINNNQNSTNNQSSHSSIQQM